MNKRHILSVLTILILYSNLFSQHVHITNSSNFPIAYVAVYNQTKTVHTISDIDGKVDLNLFSNKDSITFQHPSYNSCIYTNKLDIPTTIVLKQKVIAIDELIVSATRGQETTKHIPYFVKSIPTNSITYSNAPTAADILLETGHIAVQKSQGGGGSPIIRGFEANRILLVVDGIRMNNAIYRSGHLQNSITIDPSMLEKTEVIFGPSSVMYGSDALGGVIHYISKKPHFSADNKTKVSTSYSTQAASANQSYRTNLNLNIGKLNWGSLTNISYSKYGDIKMGNNRNPHTTPEDWGKVYHYASVLNGEDVMITNTNPNIQKRTSYSQYDILQKFRIKTSNHHEIGINGQFSSSSNISRFDQLIRYNDDGSLKYADFYYGPQQRLLTSISSNYTRDRALFSSIRTQVAYQNIKESRHSRKFNATELLNQEEKVDIISLNIDIEKEFSNTTKLNYGLEQVYNYVGSNAYYNTNDPYRHQAASRYPNGGSQTLSTSAYVNYNREISSKLHTNIGCRIGHYWYYSRFLPNDLFTPPISELNKVNIAPSGSIGLIYSPYKTWRFNGNITSGYRVPNVDDYGKIRAKNDEISLPNQQLTPEKALNFEISASKTFANKLATINLCYFHTLIRDAIVRTYSSYNGNDSIEFDGDMYRIITNTNAQSASIRGVTANFKAQAFKNTIVSATYNYTLGYVDSNNEPLGHIPPSFGRIALEYKHKQLLTELYINYQGTKYIDDMSPYGEDNDDAAADVGFPSWQTYNLALRYSFHNYLNISATVENIFDLHYKSFASVISSPGRNFIITLSGKF